MTRSRLIIAAILFSFAITPELAHAQYGGQGLGSALANNPLSHQMNARAGVDEITNRASQQTPFKIIKDVKLGMKDADPGARVQQLVKLRNVNHPEADGILIEALSDPDTRVKVKAIDILGARSANGAVTRMTQMLFLRTTEPIVKLHLVAALGRIGDADSAMPVAEYYTGNPDERGRGTAVFALGEIGSDRSVPVLTHAVEADESPMVRRLAKEALQKLGGELPTMRSHEVASRPADSRIPTDQKLAQLREFDQKRQEQER
ncbi:MAG: HEAT repeat domain-containing protein [Candidatus Binataceae bacterium]